MTEVHRQVDPSGHLTTLTVVGPTTTDEVDQTLRAFYADTPTRDLLWDFTEADISSFTPDGLKKILSSAVELAPARQGGKTAILLGSSFGYGMGRMYEILAELQSHPVRHQVFRSRSEALAWLNGKAN